MTGDELAGMRQVAVGQRNSGVGAAPGGRGHPGNHLTIDAMRQQVFEFFRAAAEDERIAALEIIAEDWGLKAEQRPEANAVLQ